MRKPYMRMRFMFIILAMTAVLGACSQSQDKPLSGGPASLQDNLVLVEGGTMKNTNTNYGSGNVVIKDFYIGRHEVTQREWVEVMGSNPSGFKGDDLPVETVSWYDAIEYCNRLSIREGLAPYYNIDRSKPDPANKSEYDPIKWIVTINEGANGYRLPTEAEWEYAASGGQLSGGYVYSGGNDADEVAWYWRNAGESYLDGEWSWPAIEQNRNRTQPVGSKKPNELGLYDMSGNVREWCWNWYDEGELTDQGGMYRIVKGGGWIGDVSNAEIAFRGKFEASGIGPDQGFRIVRSA